MKKRLILLFAAVLFAWCIPAGTVTAAEIDVLDHVEISGFDSRFDYQAAMECCLKDGGPYALQVGRIYELQRNLKIRTLNLKQYTETNYFRDCETAEEILAAMKNEASRQYTEEDLNLLSRVVYAEAGCDWFPDWVQQAVASVVLNRVNSSIYPNTIKEVVYQPGQYGCVYNGSINLTPSQKCVNNARKVLEGGSTLPSGVIGQSGYPTGAVEKSYYDPTLGTTIYFFY